MDLILNSSHAETGLKRLWIITLFEGKLMVGILDRKSPVLIDDKIHL